MTYGRVDTPNRPRGSAYRTDYSHRVYAQRLANPDWLEIELGRLDDLILSGVILDSGTATTIAGRRAYICSCRGITCRFFRIFFRVHFKGLRRFFARVNYLCELQAI